LKKAAFPYFRLAAASAQMSLRLWSSAANTGPQAAISQNPVLPPPTDLLLLNGIMPRAELNDFFNNGFGWICRQCDRELRETEPAEERSRLLREGEAESKTPRLSTRALARWSDFSNRILVCPRCGITEFADKA
jgi:hypothetical protein